MDISSIAVLGLGGAGLISLLILMLTKFFGRSNKEKILDIFKGKIIKKTELGKIEVATKEQEIILKQIKASEVSSEKTKEKVNIILKNASKDIQVILRNEELSDIEKQMNDDWDHI